MEINNSCKSALAAKKKIRLTCTAGCTVLVFFHIEDVTVKRLRHHFEWAVMPCKPLDASPRSRDLTPVTPTPPFRSLPQPLLTVSYWRHYYKSGAYFQSVIGCPFLPSITAGTGASGELQGKCFDVVRSGKCEQQAPEYCPLFALLTISVHFKVIDCYVLVMPAIRLLEPYMFEPERCEKRCNRKRGADDNMYKPHSCLVTAP